VLEKNEEECMPVFERILEELQAKLKKEGFQKSEVPVEIYDIAQGVTHGILQALACASLNPLDRVSTKIVTQSLSASTPTPKLDPPFTKPVFSYFKFPKDPWAGTAYGIQTNIPRNIALFTMIPIIKDRLEDRHYTPLQADFLAGIGAGTIESVATARQHAKKTRHQLYVLDPFNKTLKSPHEVWQEMPMKLRTANVKSAIMWGVPKCGVYWAMFPALTTFFEAQFKFAIQHYQFKKSSLVDFIEYAAAGALAGALAPIPSYTLDVMGKRAIKNPEESQFKRVWNYYCQYGMWKTVKDETHVGFIKTALPRMMISSAFFNLTLHTAKALCDVVVKKEDHRVLPTLNNR
jgi:hypothetical protein